MRILQIENPTGREETRVEKGWQKLTLEPSVRKKAFESRAEV